MHSFDLTGRRIKGCNNIQQAIFEFLLDGLYCLYKIIKKRHVQNKKKSYAVYANSRVVNPFFRKEGQEGKKRGTFDQKEGQNIDPPLNFKNFPDLGRFIFHFWVF